MSRSGTIAVVVPVEEEFAPYRELLPGLRPVRECGPWEVHEARVAGRRVVLVLSDCGPANAGAAAERVIGHFAPTVVLNGGAAGAHDPNLLPGDVVVGSRYAILFPPSGQERIEGGGERTFRKGFRFRKGGARVHFDECRTSPELTGLAAAAARRLLPVLGVWTAPGWPPGVEARTGTVTEGLIGSTDVWTSDPGEVALLYALYGAKCEDMESAYVAQVCALHGVPFLAVRVMSNNEAACRIDEADVVRAIATAGHRAATVIAAVVREL
ncbi:MAG: 5'-methylthioadenosine/S-adenosylhomocysteine nucleosidase [Holophagales bacterium]|nr:5'-methylthioadenosine/S-adenosylhomocysteine nucleosidase [Holophagales bacterium]